MPGFQSIRDTMRFWREGLRDPKNTGAFAPSSRWLGDAMARWLPARSDGYVLELGPGTGVVTEALLRRGLAPERLILVEVSKDLVRLLHRRFPGVRVICGDAFQLGRTLETALGQRPRFQAVFSSLPLLNFPMTERTKLIGETSQLLVPEGPFVQFTYKIIQRQSFGHFVHRHSQIVWLNFPPARVCVFGHAPATHQSHSAKKGQRG